jgi:nitrogen regulatory protein PII
MRPCKRIEIVIERSHSEALDRVLRDTGINAFTLIQNVGGSGDRGYRRADDVTDTDENCIFIIAMENPDTVTAIVDAVRPILKRCGGMCLVSDAEWVVH